MAVILGPGTIRRVAREPTTCNLSRIRLPESFRSTCSEPLPEARNLAHERRQRHHFPLWYMQQVEHRATGRDGGQSPGSPTRARTLRGFAGAIPTSRFCSKRPMTEVLLPSQSSDTPFATAVEPVADVGLPKGLAAPDSVLFRPSGLLYGEDRVDSGSLRSRAGATRQRRVPRSHPTVCRWLWPFARLDGLGARIIPRTNPAVNDVDHLRRQLIERF